MQLSGHQLQSQSGRYAGFGSGPRFASGPVHRQPASRFGFGFPPVPRYPRYLASSRFASAGGFGSHRWSRPVGPRFGSMPRAPCPFGSAGVVSTVSNNAFPATGLTSSTSFRASTPEVVNSTAATTLTTGGLHLGGQSTNRTVFGSTGVDVTTSTGIDDAEKQNVTVQDDSNWDSKDDKADDGEPVYLTAGTAGFGYAYSNICVPDTLEPVDVNSETAGFGFGKAQSALNATVSSSAHGPVYISSHGAMSGFNASQQAQHPDFNEPDRIPQTAAVTFGSNIPTSNHLVTRDFGSSNTTENQQPTSLFGPPRSQETGSLFGPSSTTGDPQPTGFYFGNTSSAPSDHQPAGGLFGNVSSTTSNQQTTGGLFGTGSTTSNQQTTGGLFGTGSTTSNQQTTGGLFGTGSTTSNQQTTGGLFGTGNTTSNQQTTGGLFGTGNTTSDYQPTGGLFGTGNTTSNQQTTRGLFGTSNTTSNQQTTGGLFGTGNTTSDHQPTGGLFGTSSTTSNQQTTRGLFGTGNTTSNQQTIGGLFGTGNTTSDHPPTEGLFGTSSTTSNQQTTRGLFGTGNTTSNQQTTGGLFGTSNQQSSGFSFGNPSSATSNQQPTGAGLFGTSNTTSNQQTTGGISGPINQQSTGFSFGNLSSTTSNQQTTGSPFGSSNTISNQQPLGGSFVATSNQQTGGGLFGTGNTNRNQHKSESNANTTNVQQTSTRPISTEIINTAATSQHTGSMFGSAQPSRPSALETQNVINIESIPLPAALVSTSIDSPVVQMVAPQVQSQGSPTIAQTAREPLGRRLTSQRVISADVAGFGFGLSNECDEIANFLAQDQSESNENCRSSSTSSPEANEDNDDKSDKSGPVCISTADFGFGQHNFLVGPTEAPILQSQQGPLDLTSNEAMGAKNTHSTTSDSTESATFTGNESETDSAPSNTNIPTNCDPGPVFISSQGAFAGFGVSQSALNNPICQSNSGASAPPVANTLTNMVPPTNLRAILNRPIPSGNTHTGFGVSNDDEGSGSSDSDDEKFPRGPVYISAGTAGFGYASSNCFVPPTLRPEPPLIPSTSSACSTTVSNPPGPLYISSHGAMTGFANCQQPLTHPNLNPIEPVGNFDTLNIGSLNLDDV